MLGQNNSERDTRDEKCQMCVLMRLYMCLCVFNICIVVLYEYVRV